MERVEGKFRDNVLCNAWFHNELHVPKSRSVPPYGNRFIVREKLKFSGVRTRKKRIYPDTEDKRILVRWMGASRYAYNQAVETLKKGASPYDWRKLRNVLMPEMPEWSKEIPYQVMSEAIHDACKAEKLRRQEHPEGKLHFRSRKNPKQTIFIPKNAVRHNRIFTRYIGNLHPAEDFGRERIHRTEKSSWTEGEFDVRLTKSHGRWFILDVEVVAPAFAENQGRVVAIDPGIRAFATFFSPDSCGKIGNGDFSRIMRLCLNMDRLKSEFDNTKKNKSLKAKKRYDRRKRLLKAMDRLRWKISDLVDELHFKTIRFLLDNFDVIVIPKLGVPDMVEKTKRKISSKTVRTMLSFSHFRFRQRLLFKAWEVGKSIVFVDEAYTSKTQTWNGIVREIGGAKTIRDAVDKSIVVDRDYNGARNIFLRAWRDSSSVLASA
ncbi:MAG: transposase [Synergistaceae bacterium]|nr:transposase [Synergistaceae bacterium]